MLTIYMVKAVVYTKLADNINIVCAVKIDTDFDPQISVDEHILDKVRSHYYRIYKEVYQGFDLLEKVNLGSFDILL